MAPPGPDSGESDGENNQLRFSLIPRSIAGLSVTSFLPHDVDFRHRYCDGNRVCALSRLCPPSFSSNLAFQEASVGSHALP